MPIAAARSPPRPLIPHADLWHGETVRLRQLQQPRRQLHVGALAQGAAFVRRQDRRRESSPLAGDPRQAPAGERFRLAPGAAARNRDANAPVGIDPQQIPPRPLVADEIEPTLRWYEVSGFLVGGSFGEGGSQTSLRFTEWEPELHRAQDSPILAD